MKSLKFYWDLLNQILDWSKFTTFRVDDDKQITKWDIIELLNSNWEIFWCAEVFSLQEKIFDELDKDDFDWHETYPSQQIMFEIFSWYYKKAIWPKSKLKVIKFRLIKKN